MNQNNPWHPKWFLALLIIIGFVQEANIAGVVACSVLAAVNFILFLGSMGERYNNDTE